MSRVTVCICTSGRVTQLRRCLASIEDAVAKPAEVIVADDSSDSSARALCAEFGTTYINGPQRGLCANRNVALSQVKTDFVSFIDDDGIMGRDFISIADELVGGMNQNELLSGVVIERGDAIGAVTSTYLGYFTAAPPDQLTSFHTNANILPAAKLQQVRFDEQLRYGYDEADTALGLRQIGCQLRHEPRLVNWHEPPDGSLTASRLRLSRQARFVFGIRKRPSSSPSGLLSRYAFVMLATVHAFVAAAKVGDSPVAAIADMQWAWSHRHRDTGTRRVELVGDQSHRQAN